MRSTTDRLKTSLDKLPMHRLHVRTDLWEYGERAYPHYRHCILFALCEAGQPVYSHHIVLQESQSTHHITSLDSQFASPDTLCQFSSVAVEVLASDSTVSTPLFWIAVVEL